MSAELGAAVIVDGVVVAWFADFTEEAREWCTENHFVRWLVWRAKRPETVPLTPEELAKVEAEAQRLAAFFKESPNDQGKRRAGDGADRHGEADTHDRAEPPESGASA